MQVYLIAQTQVNDVEIERWLADLGGAARLSMMSGSGAARLIELAGRRCYKSFVAGLNKNVTRTRASSEDFHRNVIGQRHGSVLEHASATFAFEGVSRVFTHELVRHRAGCAYSQESLRYVRIDEFSCPCPPECDSVRWDAVLDEIRTELRSYNERLDKASPDEKKALTSAIRRLVPMGMLTGIVATFNIRALRWIIEMRTAPAAEREIREVFREVYRVSTEQWPMLFVDFVVEDDGWCHPESGTQKI